MDISKSGAYMRGCYAKGLAFIRSKQVVTNSMVVKFLMGLGKTETAAISTATLLLSPREKDSERGNLGNCLGNLSADGIHYYMIPLKKISGQEKRFRFHLCTPEEVAARTILAAKRSLPKCRIVGNKKISKVTKKKAKKPSIIDVQQQKHASIKATGSEKPITPEPLPVVEVPATTEEDKNNSTAV